MPPRVGLFGSWVPRLFLVARDVRLAAATVTAAPRTRTSDATVTRVAGEDIVDLGWLVG